MQPFVAPNLELNEGSALLQSLIKDENGFRQLANFLKTRVGIDLPLNAKNRTLMAARLTSVLNRRGLYSYDEYINLLLHQPQSGIESEFITAMTTNTTEFFRESRHFEVFAGYLPGHLENKSAENDRDIRIWCAASSSGQEPYTIAMVLLEVLKNPLGWNIHFLASDIDRRVLEKAVQGRYSEAEIQGVPPYYRQKYFTSEKTPRGVYYTVQPYLRRMIRFAEFNLINAPYPFQHRFDFIFCRNVLIYFDRPTSQMVGANLAQQLRKNGVLFVGHSEVGIVSGQHMQSIASAAYRKDTP